jgi:hypothetical protein
MLAALTDVLTTGIVIAHEPDYSEQVLVVYQIVMVGSAPLVAVPSRWVRIVGFPALIGSS